MSEQVTPAPKAYQANVFWDRQDCATLSAQVYLMGDADSYIDALHAEAEALRANIEELDALRNRQSDLLSQTAVAVRGPEPALTRYSHADIPSRVKTVVAELEAARGLLREMDDYLSRRGDGEAIHTGSRFHMAIDAFLTATPAPEVRQFDKPSLLKDCNVTYSNSSRPLAEQGERQEAVAWILRLPDGRTTLEKSYPKWAEGEGDGYAIQPLYTTPQPGPDVRGLVEALEQADEYLSHNKLNEIGSGSILHRAMQEALAAHRQAQQGGSHDT